MSRETDYPNELETILWERLKRKNESLEKFVKRTEGSFFSNKVLDYPLLLQITKDPTETDVVFKDTIYNANYVFLKIFKCNTKSRLNKILQKVNKITETHNDSLYLKNIIIFNLLSILYEEKLLKPYARWINSEVSGEIQKAIEKDLGSFRRSINNLQKIFSKEQVSSEKNYSQEYYREKVINPIKKKAIELGLSGDGLLELATLIEKLKKSKLAELEEAKYTDAFSKREIDYSPLSLENLKYLFNILKEKAGIPAKQAKIYIAELFDLFGIRPLDDIVRKFQADEDFVYKDALKLSAKRIGDVIQKKR